MLATPLSTETKWPDPTAAAYQDELRLLIKLGASRDHGSQTLKSLASIGDSGKHKGNCKRDLLQVLGKPNSPEIFKFDIPCAVRRSLSEDCRDVSFPFMLPHLLLAYLFHSCRPRFGFLLIVNVATNGR